MTKLSNNWVIVPQVQEVESKASRIDADLLIPGRGDPIRNGSLVFEEGKILYAGEQQELPAEYMSIASTVSVPVLMPGMWDCHVHYMGLLSGNLDDLARQSQAQAGARSAKDVVATLNAGFTSVREMAGYGVEVAKAIDEGWLPGPTIYSSVSILSQTAGHGDLHTVDLDLVNDKIRHGMPLHLCDGVDECLKAVRVQVRRGAKVIKIAATGGVLSLIDSPRAAEFSPAELEAIVQEAARTDLVVAAHAHGERGIIAALHAGVHSIEHGSYLNDEAIELMLEKGVTLVATRSIVEFLLKNGEAAIGKEKFQKLQEIAGSGERAYAQAVKAGVRIALGTDIGFSTHNVPFNHGMNGSEYRFAVKAGMSALQAIEAGTANAPGVLGPRAPLSGQLKKDYDADFIALSENPLNDVEVLAQPDKVTHVWKGGKLYKSPGKPVSILS